MPDRAVPSQQLEQDLEEARRHGRWLSDDERAGLAQLQRHQIEQLDQQRQHRRKLIIVTAVCVLIPPLWPLALGLTLMQLFPRTTKRLGLVAGGIVVLLAVLVAVLITAVVVAIVMALI